MAFRHVSRRRGGSFHPRRTGTLASPGRAWHRQAMHPRPSRNSAAGGIAIAAGALGGTLVGATGFHQPTLGFLIGVAAGVVLALGVWMIDRR
jgi:hypothetical protein